MKQEIWHEYIDQKKKNKTKNNQTISHYTLLEIFSLYKAATKVCRKKLNLKLKNSK